MSADDGLITTISVRRRARISLTMIACDAEAGLDACLSSADDLFDETIVVDTGSTDRTVDVARARGARVFDFVWVDDFAAARNAALARAKGDYAFWLDADDRIEPLQRLRLAALLNGLESEDPSAYAMPSIAEGSGATLDEVRLVPVREDVRWSGRVHERLEPDLRRAGIALRRADVAIRHVGGDAARARRELERALAILEDELRGRLDEPDAPAIECAAWLVDRAGLRPRPGGMDYRDAYALFARAHEILGEADAARLWRGVVAAAPIERGAGTGR